MGKNQEEYEVQKIIQKRMKDGRSEYKIKWKGYSLNQCTWEPEANLTDCKEMVKQFNQALSKTQNTAKMAARPTSAPKEKPKVNLRASYVKNKKTEQEQTFEPEEEQNREQNQEQEQTYVKSKKKAAVIEPRKSGRLAKGTKKQGKRVLEEEDEDQNQNQDKGNEEPMEIEEPIKPSRIIRGENRNSNNEIKSNGLILGLYRDETGGMHFKYQSGSKTEILARNDMANKDVFALVQFYEQNMKFVKP